MGFTSAPDGNGGNLSEAPPPIGQVIAVQANYYFVQLEPGSEPWPTDQLLCTRPSRLRKIGQKVMVGDRVTLTEPDWQGKRAAIAQVWPRQSELDRPPIANATQILLVFAIAEPTLDPNQLTRFLIKAESTGLDICLCLSKADLVDAATRNAWQHRLQAWGYDPVCISTQAQWGLDALQQRLTQGTTIVSGPSGVGKSSLINQLIPEAALRVSAVSGKLGRGRHTTRHVELFQLPEGGLLADTPGFNQPDLTCGPEALTQYFPEITQRLESAQCQFNNCRHREEPGCVVGSDWERYPLYRQLLDDAIAYQQQQQQQATPDAAFKKVVRGKDEVTYEPRLDRAKYRQTSRRSQQQSVQVMKGNVADFLAQNPDDAELDD